MSDFYWFLICIDFTAKNKINLGTCRLISILPFNVRVQLSSGTIDVNVRMGTPLFMFFVYSSKKSVYCKLYIPNQVMGDLYRYIS